MTEKRTYAERLAERKRLARALGVPLLPLHVLQEIEDRLAEQEKADEPSK